MGSHGPGDKPGSPQPCSESIFLLSAYSITAEEGVNAFEIN